MYMYVMTVVGLMNGLMGFDPATMAALSAATGAAAGGEMDTDMAEKLAAMSASMNMMEDLQMRSKMLEELYGRAATSAALGGDLTAAAAASTSAAASKEPGETTPSPAPSHSSAAAAHSRGGKHRKSATVTKSSAVTASADTVDPDDQPEDLSMKSSSKTDAGSEGRLSRESVLRDDTADKQSEQGEDRFSRLSEPSDGRNSRLAEDRPQSSTSVDGRASRTSKISDLNNVSGERVRSTSPPPTEHPADTNAETENNQPENSRLESPNNSEDAS